MLLLNVSYKLVFIATRVVLYNANHVLTWGITQEVCYSSALFLFFIFTFEVLFKHLTPVLLTGC